MFAVRELNVAQPKHKTRSKSAFTSYMTTFLDSNYCGMDPCANLLLMTAKCFITSLVTTQCLCQILKNQSTVAIIKCH